MQRCHTCGIDEAFQAQVIFVPYDIPVTVLDVRFLHRMVGHPDNEHNPHIEGLAESRSLYCISLAACDLANKPALGGAYQLCSQ